MNIFNDLLNDINHIGSPPVEHKDKQEGKETNSSKKEKSDNTTRQLTTNTFLEIEKNHQSPKKSLEEVNSYYRNMKARWKNRPEQDRMQASIKMSKFNLLSDLNLFS